VCRYFYNHGKAKIGERVVSSKPTPAKPTTETALTMWVQEHKHELAKLAAAATPVGASPGDNLSVWRGERDKGWKEVDAEEKARYEAAAAAANEKNKKGPPPEHIHA
jgi:hypothetical protein